jgi:hypothetical protein
MIELSPSTLLTEMAQELESREQEILNLIPTYSRNARDSVHIIINTLKSLAEITNHD